MTLTEPILNLIIFHLNYITEIKCKVLSGEYDKIYDRDNPNLGRDEGGIFKGQNQIFVELYGEGFAFDTESLLKAKANLAIPSGDSNENNQVPNNEFVGTKERLELQGYYNVRSQLAYYIKAQMNKEIQTFGGGDQIRKWYITEVKKHINICNKLIAQKCINVDAGIEVFSHLHGYSNNDDLYDICKIEKNYPSETFPTAILNEKPSSYPWRYLCNFNKKPCNLFFVITPKTWKAFEVLLETTDIPKILKGWESHRNIDGNFLLNAVDPVARLKTPFEDIRSENYCDFKIAIGFTKSGLNQLIKEYKKSGITPLVGELR